MLWYEVLVLWYVAIFADSSGCHISIYRWPLVVRLVLKETNESDSYQKHRDEMWVTQQVFYRLNWHVDSEAQSEVIKIISTEP